MYVKICGITRREDAEQAVHAGASALGFNFSSRSPRYVSPEKAARLGERLAVERIGIFVDASPQQVRDIARIAQLDVVQLHGSEAPDFPLYGLRAWKAFRVGSDWHPAQLGAYLKFEAFLLDGPLPGSGTPFDWNAVRNLQGRIVLAGGLSPANVALAIESVQPWGVDACSRLESAPGIKDRQAMIAFINAAHAKEVACT